MEVSDSEIQGTLEQVDSNHDGVIDWEEFKAFMNTKIYGDK
jgi:Ca2+-binding EF-hand superfamily protein